MIIGRKAEILELRRLNEQTEAQFIAVWGRRRIGKTYLVEQFFKKNSSLFISITGEKDSAMKRQLEIFRLSLQQAFFSGATIPEYSNWEDAFASLNSCLISYHKNNGSNTISVFLDELPWLATSHSGLLNALDHAWNTNLRKFPFFRLIICGSAASWIIKNIVNNKGGLHNRLTGKINLQPFSIKEVNEFLKYHNIQFSIYQLTEIYMALGGVPYYLKMLKTNESPTQAISRLCFNRGNLVDEFALLFKSLFDNSKNHHAIIEALNSKKSGLLRSEILDYTKMSDGGTFADTLDELVQSGFVAKIEANIINISTVLYRLIDPFVLFYFKWIKNKNRGLLSETTTDWIVDKNNQTFISWSGYAFENLCFMHAKQIKHCLGLHNISCQVNTWFSKSSKNKRGRPLKKETIGDKKPIPEAQVDLVFDRDDGIVSLCEIKYSKNPYKLAQEEANNIINKQNIYKELTKTSKSIHNVLITVNAIEPSILSKKTFQNIVTISDIVE